MVRVRVTSSRSLLATYYVLRTTTDLVAHVEQPTNYLLLATCYLLLATYCLLPLTSSRMSSSARCDQSPSGTAMGRCTIWFQIGLAPSCLGVGGQRVRVGVRGLRVEVG